MGILLDQRLNELEASSETGDKIGLSLFKIVRATSREVGLFPDLGAISLLGQMVGVANAILNPEAETTPSE